MERRNFVIGLGGIAASAGLVAGSGAFSQISADRDMTVTVAETDADGYISMTPVDASSDYVSDATGEIELSFDALDGATGINHNAVSLFKNLVEIGNNIAQPVVINYDVLDDGSPLSGIKLLDDATDTDLDGTTIEAYVDDGSAAPTITFGVEIDTNTLPSSLTAPSIKITASEDTTQ